MIALLSLWSFMRLSVSLIVVNFWRFSLTSSRVISPTHLYHGCFSWCLTDRIHLSSKILNAWLEEFSLFILSLSCLSLETITKKVSGIPGLLRRSQLGES